MIYLRSVIVILLFIPFNVFSQLSTGEMEDLRVLLARKVNELRKTKGVPVLEFNDTLRKAATDHSRYMARKDVLSHEQDIERTSTPRKRVNVRGGKSIASVGENVLYVSSSGTGMNKKELEAVAERMFLAWKNSPGHYANMINPEYELGDLGFHTNTRKKRIYATQVFGKQGVVVPGQFSSNSFGIGEPDEDCNDIYAGFENIVANVGNSLEIEGNEIRLYFSNKELLNRMFSGPRDGLAIDIVTKDQVACGKPNQLDVSTIYDGVLFQPVYRDELLSRNEAEGDYRFIAKVGQVPPSFADKEIKASVILIRDGKMCKYVVPGFVPSKGFRLRPVEPALYNPMSTKLKRSGIIASQQINYDFNTNITTPISFPPIEKIPYSVHSVNISAYSSVEGSKINNEILFSERAKSIQKHIESETGQAFKVKKDSRENWAKMNFQFASLDLDYLTRTSKDSVKQMISERDESINWDSLLFDQRRSEATILYFGELNEDATEVQLAEMNLRTAIINKDEFLANKALYELYHADSTSDLIFESIVLEAIIEQPELVQNAAAVMSKAFDKNVEKATEFLYTWIIRREELLKPAVRNILYLYSLVGLHLLDEWDVPSSRLSNVIHPSKVSTLVSNNLENELILNLHLTFLQYFGQVNDAEKLRESFDYIADYFKKNSLRPEDDLALALFYNSWSVYGYTIDHLLPKFNEEKINMEGVFLLAYTMSHYEYRSDEKTLVKVHRKAAELDSAEWCAWVGYDFQILRNHTIKQLYCEVCEN